MATLPVPFACKWWKSQKSVSNVASFAAVPVSLNGKAETTRAPTAESP